MDLPRVLVVGNVYEQVTDIINKLGAKSFLDQDNTHYFVLQIDNKYYSTEILLCALKDMTKDVSIDNVEGLIICESLQKSTDNCKLESWSSLIQLLPDSEVRLLVCDSVTENSDKSKAYEWCTSNQFELVELECSDPSELQDLASEHNTFGINRVTEALHAHRWPNITLKGKASNSTINETDVNKVSDQIENIALSENNVSERLQMDNVLDILMDDKDTEFAELLGQLQVMKESVMSLPMNERRIAAEELVMAFWNDIGGDESDEFS